MANYTTIYPVPWLPSDWLEKAHQLVKDHGIKVQTKGRGPGSLEPDETAGLDYRVVTGTAIRDNATWLWGWYTSEDMCDLVSAVVGESVMQSLHSESAININFLEGQSARYELHTDGQPYSAVLMCHECDDRTGGRLMLQGEDGHVERVETKPGMLVIFDGSVVPHAVEPLKTLPSRMSMPLVYTPVGAAERPAELDGYIYAKT